MNKVTAVLPARNCRKDLHRCLTALCRGDHVPDIIVVDDDSDDRTRQMIRKHWPFVTYLQLSAHTGYAHAANAGLRLVRTEYAFLIRPDLTAGKKCISRLLEAMDQNVFCAVPEFRTAGKNAGKKDKGSSKEGRAEGTFFPETLRRMQKRRPDAEIIAVPDGCAMYRMQALEEIGWLDERHYEGLEAFDLSLRGALSGWKTVLRPGAYVKAPAEKSGDRQDGHLPNGSGTFRRQLLAGNGKYVFYKNLPGPVRIMGLPLLAAADAAQIASFLKNGEPGAYKAALERGRALCSMEKEKRTALEEGVGIWPENLSDASFLGMDEAASRIYPLFLAEKEPASFSRFGRYLHIQGMMAAELPRIIRLLL